MPAWVFFIVLGVVPLVVTSVIGATLPRWVSLVPAVICMGFATWAWLSVRARDGETPEGWLIGGAIYAAALLLAAAGGRLAHRDGGG